MSDLEYYLMRMLQEKEAARTANSTRARECHDELAAAYDLRCRLLRTRNRSTREQRVQQALENQTF